MKELFEEYQAMIKEIADLKYRNAALITIAYNLVMGTNHITEKITKAIDKLKNDNIIISLNYNHGGYNKEYKCTDKFEAWLVSNRAGINAEKLLQKTISEL